MDQIQNTDLTTFITQLLSGVVESVHQQGYQVAFLASKCGDDGNEILSLHGGLTLNIQKQLEVNFKRLITDGQVGELTEIFGDPEDRGNVKPYDVKSAAVRSHENNGKQAAIAELQTFQPISAEMQNMQMMQTPPHKGDQTDCNADSSGETIDKGEAGNPSTSHSTDLLRTYYSDMNRISSSPTQIQRGVSKDSSTSTTREITTVPLIETVHPPMSSTHHLDMTDRLTMSTSETKNVTNLSDSANKTQSSPHTSHQKQKPTLRKCKLCDYTSKYSANIYRHMRIHTGEKPFACPHCSYKASQSNSLHDHVALKHSDNAEVRLYKCSQCSFSAKGRSAVKKHIRRAHPSPSAVVGTRIIRSPRVGGDNSNIDHSTDPTDPTRAQGSDTVVHSIDMDQCVDMFAVQSSDTVGEVCPDVTDHNSPSAGLNSAS